MEHLELELASAPNPAPPARAYAVVGVVASNDLEVLIERADTPGTCRVVVDTAAKGFEASWRAVLAATARQFPLGGTRLAINDYAASPSTVALRLAQAVEALSE